MILKRHTRPHPRHCRLHHRQSPSLVFSTRKRNQNLTPGESPPSGRSAFSSEATK